MPFKKILIANRGEIAIRIARAAASLGIPTVAVFPEDDRASLRLRHADAAHLLPGRGVRAYLDMEAIVAAARATGCDAVHPGYGFLSENAAFAQRCADAGLRFIGPNLQALRVFGDKVAAKALARQARVPMIVGSRGPVTLDEAREFFADRG